MNQRARRIAGATAANKPLAPARHAAAPENPPRALRTWSGMCGFEGDPALEVSARGVDNLGTGAAFFFGRRSEPKPSKGTARRSR